MPPSPLTTDDLTFIGAGVRQPECVLALSSGEVFASDLHGGVARIAPDGSLSPIGEGSGLHPNGFGILPGRRFVIGNLGAQGGAWSMTAQGAITPLLQEIDGKRLPGVNYAGSDEAGRVWLSVSSWRENRMEATTKDAAPDGTLILIDRNGARTVADGLGYTNESRLDPSGEFLYVNETAGRRLTRYRVGANGDLSQRQTVAEFSDASFPDGLAFDAEGFCWVACVGSQRVIRVDVRTGAQQIVLDEGDAEANEVVERRRAAGEPKPWTNAAGAMLGRISGLCFGGPDLRTVYLGSLTRREIATFRSPVAGAKPYYWEF
jgi:sugar lactone lactonase YvrE